jgi:hypothetical protein
VDARGANQWGVIPQPGAQLQIEFPHESVAHVLQGSWSHAIDEQELPHVFAVESQTWPGPQLPQVIWPPHPSDQVPQFEPRLAHV